MNLMGWGRCRGGSLVGVTGVVGGPHRVAVFAAVEIRSLPSRLVASTNTLTQELTSDPIGERLGAP